MEGSGGKCGPLCQHPGCWYSQTKCKEIASKDSEYQHYLSQLLDKRKAIQTPNPRKDEISSSGLPTLKVQTFDEDRVLGEHWHHRAKTLPPLRHPALTDHVSSRSLTPPSHSDRRKAHTFAQMVLQEDDQSLDEDEDFEIMFSPVLIWKPGRREKRKKLLKRQFFQVHAPNTAAIPEHKDQVCTCTAASVEAVDGIKYAGQGRVKSPLPMGRMDLTNALPPERTTKNQVERKSTSKRVKGHERVNTADIESFNYLGDIPPQIVAEILHQLRSESSSSIGEAPLTTANLLSAGERGRTPHTLTHIPSSLIYNLSTKQLYKPVKNKNMTPPTLQSPRKRIHVATESKPQKATFGSFSRALAERPQEVMQRRAIPRPSLSETDMVDSRDNRKSTQVCLDLPTPPSPPTRGKPSIVHSQASTNLLARKDSAVRYPFGNPVVPRVPQQRVPINEEPVMEPTRAENVLLSESTHLSVPSNEGIVEVPQNSPQTSPRAINLKFEFSEKHTYLINPRRGHVIHVPRNAQSVSTHSQDRPFSEETSSTLSLDVRKLATRDAPVELQLITPTPELPDQEAVHTKTSQLDNSSTPALSEHNISLTTTSPDFMLVGAHFAGDNLVLLDSDGQMIHHLTDTESDANISRSEATMYGPSETEIYHPIVECSPPRELLECSDGTRAPPPTAVYLKRPPRDSTQQVKPASHEGVKTPPSEILEEEDEVFVADDTARHQLDDHEGYAAEDTTEDQAIAVDSSTDDRVIAVDSSTGDTSGSDDEKDCSSDRGEQIQASQSFP